MPDYLAPGVFVEEIERGPRPIQGVATTTTAFLGETARGPVQPRLITSYGEYLRLFGGIFRDCYLPHAVKGFFDNGGRRAWVARIAGPSAAGAEVDLGGFTVRAIGPGESTNRTWARIEPGSTKDAGGNPTGFRLRLAWWSAAAAFDPVDSPGAVPRPDLIEDFDDLSLNPASPSFWDKRVNHGNSSLVTIAVAEDAVLPNAPAGAALGGGLDGARPNAADYAGEAGQTGLGALSRRRDVAIVAVPAASVEVQRLLIAHCEQDRLRFAVLDGQPGTLDWARLDPRTEVAESKYAAIYYPWIEIADPETGKPIRVPPSGAVCGIYARTDNNRGVWKAPANETVAGAIGLEHDFNHQTQEVLNPKGVNLIRRFPGRGIRVWGARTLSSDQLWKYVNVRRLFIYIEHSIAAGTEWVVFEANDAALWARVKETIRLFLRSQWREGALIGATEDEAFHVAVGRDTMTEDDIANGWLIVEIGLAAVRPAEFVVFRIFQKTCEAED